MSSNLLQCNKQLNINRTNEGQYFPMLWPSREHCGSCFLRCLKKQQSDTCNSEKKGLFHCFYKILQPCDFFPQEILSPWIRDSPDAAVFTGACNKQRKPGTSNCWGFFQEQNQGCCFVCITILFPTSTLTCCSQKTLEPQGTTALPITQRYERVHWRSDASFQ